jgi:hypothetical protein
MKSFREWRESTKPVPIHKPVDSVGMSQLSGAQFPKAWKASKDEIVQHWSKLPPGMPMNQLRAVPPNHKGPTYSFDGLRITGSHFWIDFVLSRLKDVLAYEDPDGRTRLQVIYKQIVDNKTQQAVPESYVFYVQVKQRENHEHEGLPKPKFKQVPKPKTTI